MNYIKNRCNKKERELNGLSNTSKERSQCSRKHQTRDFFPVFRFCCLIHREYRTNQTKHLRNETTGHEARCAYEEFFRTRIGKLGKENSLRSFDGNSIYNHCSTKTRRPERTVEDMVQSKRSKHSKNESVN